MGPFSGPFGTVFAPTLQQYGQAEVGCNKLQCFVPAKQKTKQYGPTMAAEPSFIVKL
jgi:hypothetical protein